MFADYFVVSLPAKKSMFRLDELIPVIFVQNFSPQGVRYLGVLFVSYLAASVLYVCLEQPLASLEALTYRKPTAPANSPKSDLEANEKKANGNQANSHEDQTNKKQANGNHELAVIINKCAD